MLINNNGVNSFNSRNFGIPTGAINSGANFLNQWATNGGNRHCETKELAGEEIAHPRNDSPKANVIHRHTSKITECLIVSRLGNDYP